MGQFYFGGGDMRMASAPWWDFFPRCGRHNLIIVSEEEPARRGPDEQRGATEAGRKAE
jgi:hypothetical protein